MMFFEIKKILKTFIDLNMGNLGKINEFKLKEYKKNKLNHTDFDAFDSKRSGRTSFINESSHKFSFTP